jgi:hypothetical protein
LSFVAASAQLAKSKVAREEIEIAQRAAAAAEGAGAATAPASATPAAARGPSNTSTPQRREPLVGAHAAANPSMPCPICEADMPVLEVPEHFVKVHPDDELPLAVAQMVTQIRHNVEEALKKGTINLYATSLFSFYMFVSMFPSVSMFECMSCEFGGIVRVRVRVCLVCSVRCITLTSCRTQACIFQQEGSAFRQGRRRKGRRLKGGGRSCQQARCDCRQPRQAPQADVHWRQRRR